MAPLITKDEDKDKKIAKKLIYLNRDVAGEAWLQLYENKKEFEVERNKGKKDANKYIRKKVKEGKKEIDKKDASRVFNDGNIEDDPQRNGKPMKIWPDQSEEGYIPRNPGLKEKALEEASHALAEAKKIARGSMIKCIEFFERSKLNKESPDSIAASEGMPGNTVRNYIQRGEKFVNDIKNIHIDPNGDTLPDAIRHIPPLIQKDKLDEAEKGVFCPKPRNFPRPPLNPCYAWLCEQKLISELNSANSINS